MVCVSFCGAVEKLWVRIASSALSASNPFLFNKLLAESALEAMRTQSASKTLTHTRVWNFGYLG
jgi:hypothetical protein